MTNTLTQKDLAYIKIEAMKNMIRARLEKDGIVHYSKIVSLKQVRAAINKYRNENY